MDDSIKPLVESVFYPTQPSEGCKSRDQNMELCVTLGLSFVGIKYVADDGAVKKKV